MKLPTNIKVDLFKIIQQQGKVDEFWDMISDYITETYGCCHSGYCLPQTIEIEITDIDWDKEEN